MTKPKCTTKKKHTQNTKGHRACPFEPEKIAMEKNVHTNRVKKINETSSLYAPAKEIHKIKSSQHTNVARVETIIRKRHIRSGLRSLDGHGHDLWFMIETSKNEVFLKSSTIRVWSSGAQIGNDVTCFRSFAFCFFGLSLNVWPAWG